MPSASSGYLERLAARTALHNLKRQVAFGLAMSTLVLAVSGWNYLFVIGANDELWLGLAVAGIGGLMLARALPSAWSLPERGLSLVLQAVGAAAFTILLAVLYYTVVTPVGFVMRHSRGSGTSHWTKDAPTSHTMWQPKKLPARSSVRQSGRSLAASFLFVLQYFHARRQYVLMPFLVIVLAFGLLLFFVKSSALAPFIYTLF